MTELGKEQSWQKWKEEMTELKKEFPEYHHHEAANLLRTYDSQGESAMLVIAKEQGRPLDEYGYIFPDNSIIRNGFGYYEFREHEDWNAAVAERPAKLGFFNSNPFPEESILPEITCPQGLAAYGLMELYRQFSEDAYCAGWMRDPEQDERLQQEFKEWLQERLRKNRYMGPGSPHRHQQYEYAAIATLAKIWSELIENQR